MPQRALGPNTLLRQARLAAPSPTGSGLPMSRQELAEAVNTYLWTTHRRVTALDCRYIGKLERGHYRWPQAAYREALRSVLHADTDAALGLYATRRREPLDEATVWPARAQPATTVVPWQEARDVEGEDTEVSSRAGDDLATALRRGLLAYRWTGQAESIGLADAEEGVHAACVAYQSARYDALRRLPALIASSEQLAATCPSQQQRRAYLVVAWANLVASKLAAKLGDGQTACLTADRAAYWATELNDPALMGVTAYQIGCGLTRAPAHASEAESIVMLAADRLAGHHDSAQHTVRAVRGALLLQAAVITAREGRSAEASRRLAAAECLADHLGRDTNLYWTAFGPTNVLLHRLAVTVALRQATHAVELGEQLDTSSLPATLVSRRAQLHLDLAHAHSLSQQSDAQAMLHLLEAERIAPQVIRRGVDAHTLITTLLTRERRGATPGLRPLAQRVGALV